MVETGKVEEVRESAYGIIFPILREAPTFV